MGDEQLDVNKHVEIFLKICQSYVLAAICGLYGHVFMLIFV